MAREEWAALAVQYKDAFSSLEPDTFYTADAAANPVTFAAFERPKNADWLLMFRLCLFLQIRYINIKGRPTPSGSKARKQRAFRGSVWQAAIEMHCRIKSDHSGDVMAAFKAFNQTLPCSQRDIPLGDLEAVEQEQAIKVEGKK